MRILGELENKELPPIVYNTMMQMKKSKPGSEVVVLIYNQIEIRTIQLDFQDKINKNHWKVFDQVSLEKAELMNLVGIALKNSSKSNCEWFKGISEKLYSDAIEFDNNSKKTLLVTGGLTYLIIIYYGKWIGGTSDNDRIIRDESIEPVDDAG